MSGDRLPPQATALVSLLGIHAAARLLSWIDGGWLCIPSKRYMTPEHDIAQHIGMEAALKLAEAYAGCWLNLPRCDSVLKELNDEKIIELWLNGVSKRAISKTFRITERQVFRIIAKGRVPA